MKTTIQIEIDCDGELCGRCAMRCLHLAWSGDWACMVFSGSCGPLNRGGVRLPQCLEAERKAKESNK